ncbi:hypothetical protein EB169_07695 [archaeon]|nr:hypothetical protein [archaeon]
MKVYCQQCGSGTDYTYEKPNFCTKCGSSFSNVRTSAASTAFSRATPASRSNITPKKHQNEIEDESSIDQIRAMSSLEVDIGPAPNRKTTLRDIAGTRKEGDVSELSEGSTTPINQEEFMESFKREAGYYSSRQNPDEEA